MSAVRRRKQQQQKDDDEDLTQSLLHGDSQEEPDEPLTPRRHALIVHPGEFNLQAFIAYILSWWQRIIGQLVGLWPTSAVQPQLSPVQAERLGELQGRVAVRFDIADAAHQGDDPSTDFRGAGYYGLENLIYMGQVHPNTFRMLMEKTDGTRAQWEYPFAVAGLNLTFMLSEVLELHATAAAGQQQHGGKAAQPAVAASSRVPRGSAARGFLPLLLEVDTAFEELYCASFCLLDVTWLSMGASYMQFNAVLKRVRAEVERALESRPASLSALRARLLQAGL